MTGISDALRRLAEGIDNGDFGDAQYVLVGIVLGDDETTDFAAFEAGPWAETGGIATDLAREGFRQHIPKMDPFHIPSSTREELEKAGMPTRVTS